MFNIPLININFLKYIREIENVIDLNNTGGRGQGGEEGRCQCNEKRQNGNL